MSRPPLVTDLKQIREVLTRGVETVLPNLEALAQLMSERPLRVYLGIDPTGNQLTLGHSVVLRKLQQFANLGHEAILLVGNGTVRIGDPSGRDTTRPELSDAEIEANFKTWREQAKKILNFDRIEVRYNAEWLEKLDYLALIKLLAQTTVQQLLEREMFQTRLSQGRPIFAHELIYPLLQGYDSLVMEVDLEIGGSDQLFNMLIGRTLLKQLKNREKWVLTTPIINGTDGRKMSKSLNNYIALTEEPANLYGKIMSLADEEIMPYFNILTELNLAELRQIESALAAGENPMLAKKQLAHLITRELHSLEAAKQAARLFEQNVQHKMIPDEVPDIWIEGVEPRLLNLLQRCEPNQSRSQLRRLVEQGAVSWATDGQTLSDPQALLELKEAKIIKIGKRAYYRLQP